MNRKKLVSPRTLVLLFLCCVFWSLAGCETPEGPWPRAATAEIRVGSYRITCEDSSVIRFWTKSVATTFRMRLFQKERSWSNYAVITVLNPSSVASGRTVDGEISGDIDGHYFESGTPAVRDKAKIRIHFELVTKGLRAYCSGTFSGMAILDSLDDPVLLFGSFEEVPIHDPGLNG